MGSKFLVSKRSCELSLVSAVLTCAVLAQTAPTNTRALRGEPHLFGPGVISTPDFEFNASFTPDGKTVYFSKSDVGFNRITVVFSRNKDSRWTEPEVAPFSGVWKDTDPFVAPNGKKLFFISNRPIGTEKTPRKDYDIWFVERAGTDQWSDPVHINGPVNTDDFELYPSVTRDGTLYFCAMRGGHSGTHIYRARLVNGEYGAPELLSFSTQANDIDPTIAADESFLVFASRDRGGSGQGDLFVSFRRPDGQWSVPKNLGAPINSSFNEFATGLSADNRKLYFASNRIDLTMPRRNRINYKQLGEELNEILNGQPNIYEVDITELRVLDDGK